MSQPAFSILKTFREACALGMQHWKILVLLSLIVVIPVLFLNLIQTYVSPHQTKLYMRAHPEAAARQAAVMTAVTISLAILTLVLGAMKTAAILGVLKEPQAEAWPVIAAHIRKYTWTLIRVQILLAIFPFTLGLVISLIVAMSGYKFTSSPGVVMQCVFVFFAILYLVFIKFALANPLVVAEGMRARQSLAESWQMTRGHFGYVFGCYVFLGTADYFLGVLVEYLARLSSGFVFHAIAIAGQVATDLFGCLWIVLGWAMYQHFKSVDTGETSASVIPAN